ncbi:MAG TPA: histidine kinase [Arachnia sp.]|nr:histidine kinase [Arachnia sp.]HMT86864.1 histidine kinase [Arachnia sp.]
MSAAVSEDRPLGLPKPPGAIRRVLRKRPWLVDGTIACCYLLGTAMLAVLGSIVSVDSGAPVEFEMPDYLRPPWLLLLLAGMAITTAALLLRRRYPLSALIAVLVVLLLTPGHMVPAAGATVAAWVLLYSIPVYRSAAAGWVGYVVAVVSSLLPVPSLMGEPLTADVSGPGGVISLAITSALLMLIPVVVGINIGNRQRYTEAIIDRAHQLARERDQLARLAVAEERSRIAREMHDIVAHSVSVMIMLSEGAARAAELQPAEAAKAMSQCAETGRSALGEMRRLIGVLREPAPHSEGRAPAEMAPAPGMESLPELIEGFRAAGLVVELTLRGVRDEDASASGQGRELTIYRTVQEALTNTLRHAGPGARAKVLVDQRDGSTLVRVVDDGGDPGQAAPMAGVGSGQGLAGLGERVRLFGGTLDFGPSGRGWQVTATLPAEAPAGHGEQEAGEEKVYQSEATIIGYEREERHG